jgi:hypothetical protein
MAELKPLSLGGARCHRVSAKAILVTLADESPKQRWVPQDCIHDDSEVYESGQSGQLVIIDGSWWARKEGFSD